MRYSQHHHDIETVEANCGAERVGVQFINFAPGHLMWDQEIARGGPALNKGKHARDKAKHRAHYVTTTTSV